MLVRAIGEGLCFSFTIETFEPQLNTIEVAEGNALVLIPLMIAKSLHLILKFWSLMMLISIFWRFNRFLRLEE
jgi:hypothetical protein